jgi:chitin disaccharide deacetylase
MSDKKYLIVNADDYGRTPGVSRGIRQAHRDGIVTSTTAMMNMPAIEEDLRLAARETPDLGLGVHLVLTCGAPLLPPGAVDTIAREDGRFPHQKDLIRALPGVDAGQAGAEWDAQIRKFIALTGRKPDHLDSHHHVTYFSEPLFRMFLELARRYECAIRVPFPCQSGECDGSPAELQGAMREFIPRLTAETGVARPDWFIGTVYDSQATRDQLRLILDRLKDGVSEIMSHPGYADRELLENSAYNKPRERELEILTDPSWREILAEQGIELISFKELIQMGELTKRGKL